MKSVLGAVLILGFGVVACSSVDGDGGGEPANVSGSGGSGGSRSDAKGGSSGSAGSAAQNGGTTTRAGYVNKAGIGKTCELDSDCAPGLSCNWDTEDYIGHKQCTAPCSLSNECEPRFGEDTFCIGANICVVACRTDQDCPEKTECGDSGWCQRQGRDSGNPYCTGIPTSCGSLDSIKCIGANGCSSSGGRCTGVANSCYSQYTSYSCNDQEGCYWSSSSDDCSGSARSCSLFSSEYACEDQEGCRWEESCSGVRKPCEDTPVALCEYQPGCYVAGK